MRRARFGIAGRGGPLVARVFFKFDCVGCLRRVRVSEPNILPTRAKCATCGTWTTVRMGGFDLEIRADVRVPWSEPRRALIIRTHDLDDDSRADSVEFETGDPSGKRGKSSASAG